MFGSIGGPELIWVFVLALLLFGPRKLPEIGRTIGRALAEFRGVTSELRSNLEREVDAEELRHAEREIRAAGSEVATVRRELALSRGSRPGLPPVTDVAAVPDDQREGSPDETGRSST